MLSSPKYFWPAILGTTFFTGILFFLLYHQWLIIHFNTGILQTQETLLSVQKKPVRLYFWHNDGWHYEDTEVIWSNDTAQNIQYLINRWLSLLDEENIHSKKIIAQSVTVAPSGNEAYISFDQYPFENDSSTYQKYMFIEGLLKTLRAHNIKIAGFYFLAHHKPIEDYHLDFSYPWPLESFQKF